MKKFINLSIFITVSLLLLSVAGLSNNYKSQVMGSDTIKNESEKLVVLWTSGDAEVAENMVFMYTYNSVRFEWWKDVTLLIWGPSQKLLTENQDLQDYVKKMDEVGIKLLACKACADNYGIAAELGKLGVEVRYTGTDLTEFIKGDYHLVTF